MKYIYANERHERRTEENKCCRACNFHEVKKRGERKKEIIYFSKTYGQAVEHNQRKVCRSDLMKNTFM